jgi:hypothetical protein
MAKGLDEIHPFSDINSVDVVLREADTMLSPKMGLIGPRNAGRVWGFISKFIMLNRFAKTLFGTDFPPGCCVPRKVCTEDYLGSTTKVNIYFFPFRFGFLRQFSVT